MWTSDSWAVWERDLRALLYKRCLSWFVQMSLFTFTFWARCLGASEVSSICLARDLLLLCQKASEINEDLPFHLSKKSMGLSWRDLGSADRMAGSLIWPGWTLSQLGDCCDWKRGGVLLFYFIFLNIGLQRLQDLCSWLHLCIVTLHTLGLNLHPCSDVLSEISAAAIWMSPAYRPCVPQCLGLHGDVSFPLAV